METVRAVLVSVWLPSVSEADHLASLAEMRRLASTLGYEIVHTITQKRRGIGAAAVIGEGKLATLAQLTGGSGEIPSGVVRKPNKAKQRAQEKREKTASEGGERAALWAARGGAAQDVAPGGVDDDAAPGGAHPGPALGSADPGAAPGGAVQDLGPGGVDHDAGPRGADPRAAPGGAEEDLGPGGAGPDAAPGEAELAEVIIVDNDISPAQVRNLERATDAEVLDRSAVIIEIFHRHARTREARPQVELARLAYEAPRLREKPKRGDRQRAGSVGGAGESDLELDRRRIRDRMAGVRRELEAVAAEGGARRSHRRAEDKVALVGYTNAGKSSLMRALTGSAVLVADQLFATLGTTVRVLAGAAPPRVLLSDTVGFIKDLPHDLVASFRSTLDEARDAALLLFVVDASDPAFRAQLAVTREVLADIGAADAPQRLLLNKCDRLTAEARRALAGEFPDAWQVSAHDPDDVAALCGRLRAFFERDWQDATYVVPYGQQAVVPEIHAQARVLSETYDEAGATLRVRASPHALRRLAERLARAPS